MIKNKYFGDKFKLHLRISDYKDNANRFIYPTPLVSVNKLTLLKVRFL